MGRYVLSMLVENHHGVLSKIAGLFSRRGYNIDSLSVGETTNPEISRMTISVTGEYGVFTQIQKQLNKLYDVYETQELKPEESINRELAMIKVKSTGKNRASIIEIADIFRANIVDVGPSSLILEATGNSGKITAFIQLMEPYGILEMVRTGLTSMGRGSSTLEINNK